jgi:hypothetical protein
LQYRKERIKADIPERKAGVGEIKDIFWEAFKSDVSRLPIGPILKGQTVLLGQFDP